MKCLKHVQGAPLSPGRVGHIEQLYFFRISFYCPPLDVSYKITLSSIPTHSPIGGQLTVREHVMQDASLKIDPQSIYFDISTNPLDNLYVTDNFKQPTDKNCLITKGK